MDNETKTTGERLDSEARVRVLSPGMMVAKRFFRNKLALTGLVIIIAMFAFAFLGGMVNPYSQSQVFYTTELMNKDYAGATQIKDYQIIAAEGVTLPSDISSNTILAIGSGKNGVRVQNR
jgi:peptide/nickel transport system permease protein